MNKEMKKIYKKPIIEIIENNYLDNILRSNSEVEVTENIGAKDNNLIAEDDLDYKPTYDIWNDEN